GTRPRPPSPRLARSRSFVGIRALDRNHADRVALDLALDADLFAGERPGGVLVVELVEPAALDVHVSEGRALLDASVRTLAVCGAHRALRDHRGMVGAALG